MGEVYLFFLFGKNVCSASYALPFCARLRFNLCGSNGSYVFRCAASVAHFLILLRSTTMKKIITLVLIVACMLLLVSCGSKTTSSQYKSSSYYNSSGYYGSSNNAPSTFLGFSLGVTILILIILLIFALALPSITAGIMANNEGRNVAAWVVASLFFGWLTVFVLALNMQPNREIAITNTKTYTTKTYERYNCKRCGELINTKRCAYCNFENDVKNLKENTTNLFSGIVKNETEDWTCKCGAVNNYHNYECTNCYSPRPKK